MKEGARQANDPSELIQKGGRIFFLRVTCFLSEIEEDSA